MVVPDVSLDPRYHMTNPETRSELAVLPMIYKNRVVGVMDLESPQLQSYFTPNTYPSAFHSCEASWPFPSKTEKLYEQVARDESRMERDLIATRRIQGALLPRLPGYELGAWQLRRASFSSRRIEQRPLRFSGLQPAGTGRGPGRRERGGKRGGAAGAVAIGTLRSLGSQKPRPANMLRAYQWISHRAPDRGAFHDALLLPHGIADGDDYGLRMQARSSLCFTMQDAATKFNWPGFRWEYLRTPHTTSRASFWTQATWWFFIPTGLATLRVRTARSWAARGS